MSQGAEFINGFWRDCDDDEFTARVRAIGEVLIDTTWTLLDPDVRQRLQTHLAKAEDA